MKILYSAGNRWGAGIQLARFKKALDSKHQLKIAAFARSAITNIDWTLDALVQSLSAKGSVEDLLGHAGAPKVHREIFVTLMSEIDAYDPDLIICDGEAIVAHIAKSLSKTFWYCSPLHLLDGIYWRRGQLKYQSQLEKCRKFLGSLPKPDQYLIYSPWGGIISPPSLKKSYTWVKPYTVNKTVSTTPPPSSLNTVLLLCPDPDRQGLFKNLLSGLENKIVLPLDNLQSYLFNWSIGDSVFLTGETSLLADALTHGLYKGCLAPHLQDPEALLNVIMCRIQGWGYDLGQVELMGFYALDEIQLGLEFTFPIIDIDAKAHPTLDQKVSEYACSF